MIGVFGRKNEDLPQGSNGAFQLANFRSTYLWFMRDRVFSLLGVGVVDEIGERKAVEAESVAAEELLVQGAADLVDPDHLLERGADEHDNVELVEVGLVLVGHVARVGGDLHGRVQVLDAGERGDSSLEERRKTEASTVNMQSPSK